jgi:hypothetical protein
MQVHFIPRRLPVSIHLQRFVERLQGFEARGAKDFIMPITDAKGMHADLTRLLLELTTLKEQAISAQNDEVISIKMDGGSF